MAYGKKSYTRRRTSRTPFTKGQRIARKTYRGRGDYSAGWSKPNSFMASGMRSAGSALGGLVGMPDLGRDLGGHASKFIGWGDYSNVSTNAIIDAGHGSQQQISVNSASDLSGDVEFAHTEFVQNITVTYGTTGNTPFQIQTFPINPALSTLFPFLSQLAQNFALYEFKGLMFQYKPTSGEFGSSGSNSLGKVIFATNYDPDAPPFSSAQQMENYDYANSAKPSCGMIHGVETKPSGRSLVQMYTRNNVSTKDKVFTDLGLFQIATEGINNQNANQTQVIGELWVTYRVKLSRKSLQEALGTNIAFTGGAYTFNAAATTLNSSQVLPTYASVNATLSPYQSVITIVPPSIIDGGFVLLNASELKYIFPQNIIQGSYLVCVETAKSALAAQSITFIGTDNGPPPPSGTNTNVSIRNSTTSVLIPEITSANILGSSANAFRQCIVTVKAPGSSVGSFIIKFNTTVMAQSDLLFISITQCAPNMGLV